ncbi:AraC family transcriptional regulator N-terminal domain-containing protein [Rhizobium leguminosarum]
MTQISDTAAFVPAMALRGIDRLAKLVNSAAGGRHVAVTDVDGLTLFRAAAPGVPMNCVYEPCIALIIQGRKHIVFGGEEIICDQGAFFATAIDIPTSAHITVASSDRPYLSLVLKLDLAVINEVLRAIPEEELDGSSTDARGIAFGSADPELIEAFIRLVSLLDRSKDIPVISGLIRREIYYHLLNGDAGALIRKMVSGGYRSKGTIKVLDWLKRNYAQPLEIEALVALSGMARSTLHHKFRDLTGTSPLQYQKSLRLYAARTTMVIERVDANTAAISVGYESVSQFNREYTRMFGIPPGRDVRARRRSEATIDRI